MGDVGGEASWCKQGKIKMHEPGYNIQEFWGWEEVPSEGVGASLPQALATYTVHVHVHVRYIHVQYVHVQYIHVQYIHAHVHVQYVQYTLSYTQCKVIHCERLTTYAGQCK